MTTLAVLSAGIVLAGCGGGSGGGAATGGPGVDTGTASTPATSRDEVAVGVYFATTDGRLVRSERMVPAADPVAGALAELIGGPTASDQVAAVPPGTRVLDAGVDDGVVTVDLSGEFETGYPPGGSAAELAIVAPLVHTAAEAAGADAVLITVEGRVPAPVGSQLDFREPLRPSDLPG